MMGTVRHLRPQTALVTGAAGFIGSHLCDRLLSLGWAVRGVDCLTDYYDPRLKRDNASRLQRSSRFSFEALDLASAPLEEVVDGVDVIFHLAGQPGVRASFGPEFELYVQRNVLATQRLLEAASVRPPRAFVYASSSSVYGDAETYPTAEDVRPRPVSPYGMTKLATEELAETYWRTAGVPTVGLRYFTVYGPRQRPDMAFNRFVDAALDDRELTIYGDGAQIRDFTYVADAVDATIASANSGVPGTVYNVGGGSPVKLIEIIPLIGRLVGRDLRVVRGERVRGDAWRTGADTTRARRDLGFRPRWDLEHGLAVQLQHALRLRRERTHARSGLALVSAEPRLVPGAPIP